MGLVNLNMRQQRFLAPLLAAFVCGVVGSFALAQDEEAATEQGVVVEYSYSEDAEAEPAEEAAPAGAFTPFAEPALDDGVVEVEGDVVIEEAAAVEFGVAAPAQGFLQV
jgi:hypothetical protein